MKLAVCALCCCGRFFIQVTAAVWVTNQSIPYAGRYDVTAPVCNVCLCDSMNLLCRLVHSKLWLRSCTVLKELPATLLLYLLAAVLSSVAHLQGLQQLSDLPLADKVRRWLALSGGGG